MTTSPNTAKQYIQRLRYARLFKKKANALIKAKKLKAKDMHGVSLKYITVLFRP